MISVQTSRCDSGAQHTESYDAILAINEISIGPDVNLGLLLGDISNNKLHQCTPGRMNPDITDDLI